MKIINKKGTTIVEASLIFPVVIIAVMSIIYISVSMYEKIENQCNDHLIERENQQGDEVDFVRKIDLTKMEEDN
ncbi:TadE/TadG family type IV pilus assembly protein [Anaerovorax odorimutans]|uniref:TadE/TadG family type IV pilus assembly protein n=1 Tax=Anaerovorax odorimutans TaxID=109327 RepID=UPI0003F9D6E9|nr:TadE family protein [Anaerovorax odorimutans]